MKATARANKLLAIAMATVLLLPYTAPGVCGLLGRVAGDMEMSHESAAAVMHSPTDGATCCSVDACGIPQVAPPGCDVTLMAEIIDAHAGHPTPVSADPTTPRFLLTPPPKA